MASKRRDINWFISLFYSSILYKFVCMYPHILAKIINCGRAPLCVVSWSWTLCVDDFECMRLCIEDIAQGVHTHTHTTQRSISNIIMMQIKVFLCIKLFTWIEMLNEQEPMRISSFSSALQAESGRACMQTCECVYEKW